MQDNGWDNDNGIFPFLISHITKQSRRVETNRLDVSGDRRLEVFAIHHFVFQLTLLSIVLGQYMLHVTCYSML